MIPWEHLPFWMKDGRLWPYIERGEEIPRDLLRDLKLEEMYRPAYQSVQDWASTRRPPDPPDMDYPKEFVTTRGLSDLKIIQRANGWITVELLEEAMKDIGLTAT